MNKSTNFGLTIIYTDFLEKENMKNLTDVNVNFGNVMITMTMGLR